MPLYDSYGNPVAVTDISIQPTDDPYGGTEQQFPTDSPQEEQLTLNNGVPDANYNVGVSWADGSQYSNTVTDFNGGQYIRVDQPNQ